MPWARIDDGFYDHPKIVEAIRRGGLATIGLHALALSYCNRHLTDGFVSDGWVGRRVRLAEVLVKSTGTKGQVNGKGIWERVEGGYRLHDYLKFNQSAKEVKARRRLDSERKRRKESDRNPGGIRVESARNPAPPTQSRPSPIPSRPKELKIVTTTETGFIIPDQLLALWKETYPAVDVPRVVRESFAWAVANPQNRKSNWARFLTNWLKREQDRAPRVPSPPPPPPRAAIQDLPALPPEEAAANIRRLGGMVQEIAAKKVMT